MKSVHHGKAARLAFLLGIASRVALAAPEPFLESELIFPLETWHNHASCVVETLKGGLLVCWFHGSGERTADDVVIEGARLPKGSRQWSAKFVMADTPTLPDGNPCMLVDSTGRLWLWYTTIMANTWESALLKVRTSRDYSREGPPRWDTSEVLHVKPGPEFETEIERCAPALEAAIKSMNLSESGQREAADFLEALKKRARDKLYRRLGWMTRAHPVIINSRRIIVPLYHDGFSISLMAISDDWGLTWHTSSPLVAGGNIQPSVVQRRDGSLYVLMRDNGPPPHRLHQSESRDLGETWAPVTASDLPNPGSGAEVISLRNGHWVLIGNDTESGRHQLAVQISEDEGRTWPYKRYLEKDPAGTEAGSYHYPSIIQAKDGSLHATYSYFGSQRGLPKVREGDPATKSIKHAHFNEEWIKAAGNSRPR